MAKRSLKLSWDLCMEQWDWIKAEIEAGNTDTIKNLKDRWMKGHEHERVFNNCFFCDYDHVAGARACSKCPGRLVDPNFNCQKSAYDYADNPLAFHAELTRLYKIFLKESEA